MVKLLKFTEIWNSHQSGREHESDLYINEDSIDSIETFNEQLLQIHTKAGQNYKIKKDESVKIISKYLIQENDGVA